jgi:hypothetical protein
MEKLKSVIVVTLWGKTTEAIKHNTNLSALVVNCLWIATEGSCFILVRVTYKISKYIIIALVASCLVEIYLF